VLFAPSKLLSLTEARSGLPGDRSCVFRRSPLFSVANAVTEIFGFFFLAFVTLSEAADLSLALAAA
jgi:hypothetical protein